MDSFDKIFIYIMIGLIIGVCIGYLSGYKTAKDELANKLCKHQKYDFCIQKSVKYSIGE